MKAVCVFCGSNSGARPDYGVAAEKLGREIAGRGLTLVYGGARVGLMGRIADAGLAAGGEVVGIMPSSLIAREVAHPGLTRFHETASMHERKKLMADLADAFVAMPGGAGTLEEAFEIWTWAQLGLHEKPLAFLDVAGFYDPLIAFLDHLTRERFMREEHRRMLLVDDDPARLLDALADYRPPAVTKWIEPSER